MYELEWIRSLTDKVKDFDRMPRIQKFEAHSPVMIGAALYFVNREGDGHTLITSPVIAIYSLHQNIMEIQTKNSIYQLRKL